MKRKLLGMTPDELKEVARDCGLPGYASGQIAKWMYVKRVRSIDGMSDISKDGREALKEKYELGVVQYVDMAESADGTKKYLFPFSSRETSFVEAVMIPDEDRATLCVSSQSGCKMGCKFCMTGRQGFHGNLDVADILSQFISIDESHKLTNAVFMGMGEPLDNYENMSKALTVLTAPWGFAWSPKRVTVSTIGVLPKLKTYLENSRCHLAVSVHDPFADERETLMPAQKIWGVDEIISLIKKYDFTGQRRVSFEYTMFAGFNDDKRHADSLARLLRGLECRVNLIRFHQIPDFPYKCPPTPVMEAFRDRLTRQGITTTIRASRGEDILAACGMLAGKHTENQL